LAFAAATSSAALNMRRCNDASSNSHESSRGQRGGGTPGAQFGVRCRHVQRSLGRRRFRCLHARLRPVESLLRASRHLCFKGTHLLCRAHLRELRLQLPHLPHGVREWPFHEWPTKKDIDGFNGTGGYNATSSQVYSSASYPTERRKTSISAQELRWCLQVPPHKRQIDDGFHGSSGGYGAAPSWQMYSSTSYTTATRRTTSYPHKSCGRCLQLLPHQRQINEVGALTCWVRASTMSCLAASPAWDSIPSTLAALDVSTC
jgi:hypothetical protein